MTDQMSSDRVAEIGQFLEGLNDLTAKTGVFIDFYAGQPVSIDVDGPGGKALSTGLEVADHRDGDGLIRYQVRVRDN